MTYLRAFSPQLLTPGAPVIMTYEFTLRFARPPGLTDSALADALGKAGCTDGLVGLGNPDVVAIEFERSARTIKEALLHAQRQICAAFPGMTLFWR